MLLLFAVVGGLASSAPLPVSAQEDRAADTDARALFQEGREAYDAGRFEDATRAFRRAYLLSPRYQLLYNIGQSELRAGHDARALEAFEGFLRQASADDPNRSEVAERARVLRSMGVTSAAEEPAADAATETAETETETETEPASETEIPPLEPVRSDGPGVAPWIVVGVGGAAIVAGVILMGVGAAESSRVTGATDGARWSDLEGAASSANVLWGAGIGVAAVGLAAGVVGIVWGLSGGASDSEGGATARLRVGPLGLGVEGEF
jgi:tetratricopeptide (TPR) repeat protein